MKKYIIALGIVGIIGAACNAALLGYAIVNLSSSGFTELTKREKILAKDLSYALLNCNPKETK